MFYPESCHTVALNAITSKSHPRRKQTFMKDDLVADTEAVIFDWNIVMEQTGKYVQRSNCLPDDDHSEKPRRALSSYNIFFQHQREQIKKELADASLIMENRQLNKDTHRGKMLFAELARTVATRWKKIEKETRAPYEQLAAQDKIRYEREMKQWRYLQSSILHRIEAGNVFGSVIQASFQEDTFEHSCCDIGQRGIHSLQLSKSCWETSSTSSEQFTVTSTPHPSMMQSYNNTFVSTQQSSTTREEFDTFAKQEQLQHTLHVAEVSGTDRLKNLAESLGNERLELLLHIFGTCCHEQQHLPLEFHREL